MSVIAFQRPVASPLNGSASFLALHRTKLSSTKEILDKLVTNKSYNPPDLPEPIVPIKLDIVNISSELNELSSPEGSPCRDASKLTSKSPKKGILVRRKMGQSSVIGSTTKFPNESSTLR